MTKAFTVSMAKIIEENGLETVYMPCDPANLMVSSRRCQPAWLGSGRLL